jgi:hypothetical protein
VSRWHPRSHDTPSEAMVQAGNFPDDLRDRCRDSLENLAQNRATGGAYCDTHQAMRWRPELLGYARAISDAMWHGEAWGLAHVPRRA